MLKKCIVISNLLKSTSNFRTLSIHFKWDLMSYQTQKVIKEIVLLNIAKEVKEINKWEVNSNKKIIIFLKIIRYDLSTWMIITNIIILILTKCQIILIYVEKLKMVAKSPSVSFSICKKWLHVFTIVNRSIELIISDSCLIPDFFSTFITACGLLDEINLLSCQKNNSTGASSGAYCRRKKHDHLVSLR